MIERLNNSGDDLIVEYKNNIKKDAIEKLISIASNRPIINLQIHSNIIDSPINFRKPYCDYEIKYIDIF